MALATYDDLVASIIRWNHRKDLNKLIPDFITLAENEFFANTIEPLKIRPIEKTAILTAIGTPPNESRFIALPAGYISQRDLKITIQSDIRNLNYVTPNALIIRSGAGTPCMFTVTDQIELDIIPDQDYTLTMKFFSEPAPLTKANQTNEILTSDPNIYLFGALHQAKLFSEDDNEAVKWFNKFISAIQGANERYKAGAYGPAPAMKIKGPTP